MSCKITFTPEDVITTVPMLIWFNELYMSVLLPVGVASLIIGLMLLYFRM